MTGILNALIAGVSGAVKDAYFNLVSLLLPGNGTNGAQNNTFLDGSSNTFTITRNGNTTQGTFSPFSQTGWGNYFNGSSSVNFANNAGFNFSTGDFTIEAWVYITGNSSLDGASRRYANIFSVSTTADINANFVIRGDSTTTGTGLEIYNGTSAISVTGSISQNAWNHVAVSRSGANAYFWLNGQQMGATQSISGSWGSSTNAAQIGQSANTSGYPFPLIGYLSNVRVVKGRAVYTTAFTPPATPLTRTTGGTNPPQGTECSLLTAQSNRFLDSNGVNTPASSPLTITTSGSPSVTPFSPFAPTAAYTTAAVGGSGYFDGTRDYLTLPSTSNLAFGTGDFSIEAWVYPTSVAEESIISNATTSGASDTQLTFYIANSVRLSGWFTVFLTGSTNVSVNAWSHVVVCRTGTTMSIFLNGARDATGTVSNNFSSTNAFWVGAYPSATAGDFNGYITNLRVLKGSSAYDPTQTTITIPTAPPTAVTNTQLLLNFTNAGVVDATAKNVLETVGNAQISTSVSKFGGGSIAFNGTTDYLKSPASTAFNCGTGNWTIEGWVYISSYSTNFPIIIGNNNGSFSAGALGFTAQNAGNNKFSLAAYDINPSAATLVASVTNSTGTWYYVALVRNGTSLTMYRDGTSVASTTISAGVTFDWGKSGLLIAGASWDGAASYFNGYIDDLRLTKYARYTSNFTAPTAPFPVQ